ncbi:hypothetical protein C2845_PM15G00940 [Panicum miliaceum]|uniref:DUF8039 domain-containing protein n=1 Tax=Panicum miliaceum TaxID=4540 RepID=A0A3L6Q7F6_PANMI|nr:hypothetical protein C2845_PM15G00940 [Panicum miliaceum]
MLIELGQGVVLPEEKVYHMVPLQDGYVVVKIDHVHQKVEAIPLDIPLPNAEIFTLGDARNTRIQWKKSGILIQPISWSSSTGGAKSGHAPQLLVHFVLCPLNKESKERQLGVAFIDPQQFSATVIAQDPDHCMQQGSGNKCGFYVAYHMIRLTATFKNFKGAKDDKDKLEKQQLLAIREKVASLLLVDVISDKGSRWLPNPSCAPGCSRKRKMILLGSSIKGDGQQPKPVTCNIHQVTAPGSIARHL